MPLRVQDWLQQYGKCFKDNMGLYSEGKKAVPRKAIIEALKKTEDPSFLNRMNTAARVQFGEETFPPGHEMITIEEFNGKIKELESEAFYAENQKATAVGHRLWRDPAKSGDGVPSEGGKKSIADHKIRLLKKIK